jgi:hypothetical protein
MEPHILVGGGKKVDEIKPVSATISQTRRKIINPMAGNKTELDFCRSVTV